MEQGGGVKVDWDRPHKEVLDPNSTTKAQRSCVTCVRILDVVNGEERRSVELENLPELGPCDAHESFLKGVFDLARRLYAEVYTGNRYYDGVSRVLVAKQRSTISQGSMISVRGRHPAELLIARLGGREDEGFDGRPADRNWIDPGLMRGWKETCEREHGEMCSSVDDSSLSRPRLPWLIDCEEYRLVPPARDDKYVALSYVWGNANVLKTSTQNLRRLCENGAFLQPNQTLPRTIKDAIHVVRLLGERYLWVDALCIVQNDENTRKHLIDNMAAVYANALLTIVAAEGNDADSGLNGLQGVSEPRNNPCIFHWPDGTQLNWPGTGGLGETEWNTRGWTFQEYIFSRRKLIFAGQSVRWECREKCFWEEHRLPCDLPTSESHACYDNDLVPIRQASLSKISHFPDVESFKALVRAYCEREFTWSEDSMDAFSGIATALTPSFPGGFLWGTPVMFLDMCMIWRGNEFSDEQPAFFRRWDPSKTSEPMRHAPTWSWVAWKGKIQFVRLWRNEDFVLWNRDTWFYAVDYIKRVFPLVRWSTRQTKTSTPLEIPHQNAWFDYKVQYTGANGDSERPPAGWTRWLIDLDSAEHQCSKFNAYTLDPEFKNNKTATINEKESKFLPRCYYTHDSIPSIKFNYPIPLGTSSGSNDDYNNGIREQRTLEGRYLCCTTQRAYFALEFLLESDGRKDYGLVDPEYHELSVCTEKEHHGFLWVHEQFVLENIDRQVVFGDEKGELMRVELVAVSMLYRHRGGHGCRWAEPLGEERPQWYNVLWVEWIDGVAYRKGVGEVRREVWESRERGCVELVLG